MSNPLAVFFTQPVKIRRLTGSGPYGDVHAAEETVLCRLKQETRLVRDASGQEVTAQATASMAADTAAIDPGSLADIGDGHWRTVIASARHVGGFPRSPDYYSIDLS